MFIAYTHDGQRAVDLELGVCVRYANAFHYDGEVIAGKSIAAPLREETECGDQEKPVAVALGLEEVEVAGGLLVEVLEAQSFLDLGILEQNCLALLVAICMIFPRSISSCRIVFVNLVTYT